MRKAPPAPVLLGLLVLAPAAGCTPYQPFDSSTHLRQLYARQVGEARAREIEVPFELNPEIRALAEKRLRPAADDRRRVQEVLDFIFGRLGLSYALTPTRNAAQTFAAREGNCLSFVNLFIGLAREQRLNPFYVEVTDFQRWNYREGLVVSQGHIVAGLYEKGELKTYDFLPYRPKSYKKFRPIDDLTAAAHFYNNLGAEALMAGDLERAERLVRVAAGIAPGFVKAINNLGVLLARRGDAEQAVAVYRRGLELEPENAGLLTNMARAYQQLGRHEEAIELLARVDSVRDGNPFLLVYRGELALSEGRTAEALEYMARALRLDTEVPEVHVGLVKVYVALGDLERARHHLARALRLDATHEEARRFARMLEERGRTPPGPERP